MQVSPEFGGPWSHLQLSGRHGENLAQSVASLDSHSGEHKRTVAVAVLRLRTAVHVCNIEQTWINGSSNKVVVGAGHVAHGLAKRSQLVHLLNGDGGSNTRVDENIVNLHHHNAQNGLLVLPVVALDAIDTHLALIGRVGVNSVRFQSVVQRAILLASVVDHQHLHVLGEKVDDALSARAENVETGTIVSVVEVVVSRWNWT